MTKPTSKGIYTEKTQNHPYTNMLPKIRNHEKSKLQMQTLAIHLQLRDQQLKTISYLYRILHQNFRLTENQKSTIDTQTSKKNQLKYNTKDSHQTTRGENKRRRKEKRATKTNPKQLIKWQ